MGAHIVPARKLVIATPWQPVSQPLQQSGTLPGIRVRQLLSLQGLAKLFGGGTTGVVAGSSTSMNAQSLARMLDDSKFAQPHTSEHVGLVEAAIVDQTLHSCTSSLRWPSGVI